LNPARESGEALQVPNGVWGRSNLVHFSVKNVISGGNNLNDFPQNQLSVYTVKVNQGPNLFSVVYAGLAQEKN